MALSCSERIQMVALKVQLTVYLYSDMHPECVPCSSRRARRGLRAGIKKAVMMMR